MLRISPGKPRNTNLRILFFLLDVNSCILHMQRLESTLLGSSDRNERSAWSAGQLIELEILAKVSSAVAQVRCKWR
jgi:hypothetical protein